MKLFCFCFNDNDKNEKTYEMWYKKHNFQGVGICGLENLLKKKGPVKSRLGQVAGI